jgi:hypothetical protein
MADILLIGEFILAFSEAEGCGASVVGSVVGSIAGPIAGPINDDRSKDR